MINQTLDHSIGSARNLTTHSTVTDTNKSICLLCLFSVCLFSPPHPGHIANYTCIDKSDFQNGSTWYEDLKWLTSKIWKSRTLRMTVSDQQFDNPG